MPHLSRRMVTRWAALFRRADSAAADGPATGAAVAAVAIKGTTHSAASAGLNLSMDGTPLSDRNCGVYGLLLALLYIVTGLPCVRGVLTTRRSARRCARAARRFRRAARRCAPSAWPLRRAAARLRSAALHRLSPPSACARRRAARALPWPPAATASCRRPRPPPALPPAARPPWRPRSEE